MYKTFKTRDKCYVYDSSSVTISKIDTVTYAILSGQKNKKIHKTFGIDRFAAASKTINSFSKKYGMFTKSNKQIILRPEGSISEMLQSDLHMLQLKLTNSCNFRCLYCQIGENPDNYCSETMDCEILYRSVDYFMKHSPSKVAVSFYGGEPLLALDRLQETVEYIQSSYPEKIVTYHITTNGTLLSSNTVSFLKKCRMLITVSIDGPAFIHDDCRNFEGGGGIKWSGLSIQQTVFFKVDSLPVLLAFFAALERRE